MSWLFLTNTSVLVQTGKIGRNIYFPVVIPVVIRILSVFSIAKDMYSEYYIVVGAFLYWWSIFGYFSGGCMLYSFDEATGALQFSHKIELQTQHMLSILFVIFLMQFEQYYHPQAWHTSKQQTVPNSDWHVDNRGIGSIICIFRLCKTNCWEYWQCNIRRALMHAPRGTYAIEKNKNVYLRAWFVRTWVFSMNVAIFTWSFWLF